MMALAANDLIRNALIFTGAVTLALLALRLATFLFHMLRPPVMDRYLTDGPDGTWALVTGASDGIGRALARELCVRGFNVIVHGRNEKKLQGVLTSLQKDFPQRELRLYVANASTATSCDAFVRSLPSDIHLTMLINNVGGPSALPSPFLALHEFTDENVGDMINLNAGFATRLTAALLPVLFRQRRALILNVASLVRIGMPYLAVYSGAKGYLFSWSEGLKAELLAEGRNVDVYCSEVGQVNDGDGAQESYVNPSPETFAKAALDRVGKGDVAQYSYLPHAVQIGIVKLLPAAMRRRILIDAVKKSKADHDKKH